MSFPPTVLLDLDGALVDSLPGIAASCRAALAALGHDPDRAPDVAGLIGPPIEDIMHVLLAPFGDDRIDEAVSAYRDDYGARGLLASDPYPGIPEALDALRAAGAQLILATSKRRTFAERILDHTGLAPRFAAIHGSEPGGALDHKPELIAHILARHGLDPAACVMVGDRRYDISGAHANGVRALGVLWGYGSREELEAAGADALVADPQDLADAALGLGKPPDWRD
ncbi:HAD hydrolase-like protein [Phenylobacterium sp. LjRoot164]|uniref:HAD hydrolase-like protein n=1 Tax=unclassified Phenylobacterium TaxID=2640670 RepID=UPI003ED0F471